eukprot:153200_1
MSTKPKRLDVKYYKRLCPHKLIKDYPVSQNDSESYWKSKMKKYGSVIKESSWTPVKMFNIICQHPECKSNKGWLNRRSAVKWKSAHHDPKHGKETSVSIKVLSYWT